LSRCDFALDDRRGLVTLERLLEAKRRGTLVTRWRDEPRIVAKVAEDGFSSWTVYLGSRESDSMLRVYDKAAQQGRSESWIRVELECHGKFADALAREYFSRGSVAVLEQLVRRVRFVEPQETDSNLWRAPMAAWWRELVGGVAPGASLLAGELPETTIARLWQFIERQAGPALATCLKASGGDLQPLLALVDRSTWRLKSKHMAALAAEVSRGQ